MWVSCTITAYADDTFATIEANTLTELKEKIESEGEKVLKFFASNGMVANPSKTGLLVFRPSIRAEDTPLKCRLSDQEIAESSEERILGVVVSNDLKWTSHVRKVKSECNYYLSVLRRLQRVLGYTQLKMIADGVVMSRLRYCIAVHGAEQLRQNDDDQRTQIGQDLQRIQNEMLRIITGSKKKDHVKIADMLESTKMLSINQLIGYSILMEVWKAKSFEIPHLSNLLVYDRKDDRKLRSNTNLQAVSSMVEPYAICAKNLWNQTSNRFKTTNLITVAKIEAKKVAKTLPVK